MNFLVSVLIFFVVTILHSQDAKNQIAVFPYRVELHNAKGIQKSETELPILFQQASIFLLKLLFESEFLDETNVNSIYPLWKQGLSEIEARVQISKICQGNHFSYFVTGEVSLIEDRIILDNHVFSCKTFQKLYSSNKKEKIDALQNILRENLRKIFPFLKENSFYKKWISRFSAKKEVYVLLDVSGSMEMMSPILKRILDPNTMHIYGITRNGINKILDVNDIQNSGENTTKDLILALEEIKKEILPFQSELWIFYDSFLESSKEMKNLGIQIKEFHNFGVGVKIFQTYKMMSTIWSQLETFAFYQNYSAIPVIYGRTCGFSDGSSYFFLRKGGNFFLCKEDKEIEYLKEIYPVEECIKLPVYNYTSEDLDLDQLCSAYEKKNKTKLLYVSSVKTNLDKQVNKNQKYDITGEVVYKFLLKNEDTSFWIYTTDQKLLNQLLEYKNQGENFYIGLSFDKKNQFQSTLNKILFLKQKEIPKLFLVNYKELEKRTKIYSDDIWFFWVRILDMRYE
ncbi:MAG: hypothetical protein ACK4UJ_04215 [Leptonema sp. (in: bacteria)]